MVEESKTEERRKRRDFNRQLGLTGSSRLPLENVIEGLKLLEVSSIPGYMHNAYTSLELAIQLLRLNSLPLLDNMIERKLLRPAEVIEAISLGDSPDLPRRQIQKFVRHLFTKHNLREKDVLSMTETDHYVVVMREAEKHFPLFREHLLEELRKRSIKQYGAVPEELNQLVREGFLSAEVEETKQEAKKKKNRKSRSRKKKPILSVAKYKVR